MRFNDIKPLQEDDLFEINMSPSSLKKLAADIDARAGMEFEMIVPNAGNVDDDSDMEPDYDEDQRTRSFDDIESFFDDGNYNSSRDVERAVQRLREEFWESMNEDMFDEWQDNEFEVVKEYAEGNADDDEVREALDLPEDHEITDEDWINYTNYCIENQTIEWEKAREYWEDDWRSDVDEERWLSRNYPMMSDIGYNVGLTWPYWSSGGDGEANVEELAKDFGSAIGKPVHYSTSYHGAKRSEDAYSVEPDGSLDPDDSDDAGLEFISPPMTVQEMFDDLDAVRVWAKNNNCYTNKSTGLHMNVSVPGWSGDLNKLDYVKLALLLGDEYVLKQFDRINNTYTKPAIDKVREQARQRPEDVAALLKQMKQHLNDAASKVIHSGVTHKYTSINTKDGYIEFRSPGGNWLADLQNDPNKIKNTLLRFVVALDAAVNPEKYREEYLKKLYKLLGAGEKGKDTIKFFADYVAGKMPKLALKSFIKQAQLERNIKKGDMGGEKFWWEVKRPGYMASIEVVATSKEEAIKVATQPENYPDWANARNLEVRPLRPYDKSPVKATVGEPQPVGGEGSRNYLSQTDIENRLGWGSQAADANYEVVDRGNNRSVFKFIANTPQEAQRKYGQVLDVFGFPHDTENYGFREIALPGSTVDLQRQRAAQAQSGGGEFTGNWRILSPNGSEIHRFGGVGNVQADANRAALRWLRDHPEHIQQGVEVVPEIR